MQTGCMSCSTRPHDYFDSSSRYLCNANQYHLSSLIYFCWPPPYLAETVSKTAEFSSQSQTQTNNNLQLKTTTDETQIQPMCQFWMVHQLLGLPPILQQILRNASFQCYLTTRICFGRCFRKMIYLEKGNYVSMTIMPHCGHCLIM